jgi:hypothetical protein
LAAEGRGSIASCSGYPARSLNIVRDRYPLLHKARLDAGAVELTFFDGLPGYAKKEYKLEPGDEDLSLLLSRRTTLEYVARAYAATRPGVEFIT